MAEHPVVIDANVIIALLYDGDSRHADAVARLDSIPPRQPPASATSPSMRVYSAGRSVRRSWRKLCSAANAGVARSGARRGRAKLSRREMASWMRLNREARHHIDPQGLDLARHAEHRGRPARRRCPAPPKKIHAGRVLQVCARRRILWSKESAMATRRVPTYELSEDAERVLQSIRERTGATVGALLSEAISLLDLVVAAKQKGEKVVITDEEEVPLQEVELNVAVRPQAT
jgi:hypothetical protein